MLFRSHTVNLIDFGGKRRVFGFNNRANGYLDKAKNEARDQR